MHPESWIFTVPLRLRSLFHRKQTEQDLDDELQFHLAQRVEQEMTDGKTPEEARYAALRAMDRIEQQKKKSVVCSGCASCTTFCKMRPMHFAH